MIFVGTDRLLLGLKKTPVIPSAARNLFYRLTLSNLTCARPHA
jgi:hypothetical protein